MNRLKLWRAFCGVLAFFVNENALGHDPRVTARMLANQQALDLLGSFKKEFELEHGSEAS